MLRTLAPTAAPLGLQNILAGLLAAGRSETFEAALAERFGGGQAYGVYSGRVALRLILETIRQGNGRQEVIIPAYSCPDLVTATLAAGLRPVFCDVDPHTLDFDEETLWRLLGDHTLAVIHVHLFGLPRPTPQLAELSQAAGAILVEDACQALGARWGGRPVGTLTEIGCASFGHGKPLSLGGGGVIFVQHERWRPAVAGRVDALPQPRRLATAATWGRLALLELLMRPTGYWLATRFRLRWPAGDERQWTHPLQRLSSLQAAIGLRALPHLARLNAARRQVGQALTAALAGVPHLRLMAAPAAAEPIYLRFPILLEDPGRRDLLLARLWTIGVEASKMYPRALPQYFPHLPAGRCPGAEMVAQRLVTLPTHPFVQAADVGRMVAVFSEM
ncbi:MAG: DegT/DnrJ/EryC1/StrS family aminotransferase [Chloroflexota bacterium]